MISRKIPDLYHTLAKNSKVPFVRDNIKLLTSQEWAVIEKEVRSEHGKRGNQGTLDVIVRTGISREAPLHIVESAHLTATLTPLSGQESLARMPLHLVESMHTTAASTPLSGQESLVRTHLHLVESTRTKATSKPLLSQESIPRTHLLTLQGGHMIVEGFAPTFA